MELRQQAELDVKRILSAHGPDLGNIRAFLDLAVQETGGYWEDPNPDFVGIDANVRAGHVRQFAAGQMSGSANKAPVLRTLKLKVVSFAGLHLYTPEGQRMRTRKRPVNRRTGKPMRAVDANAGLEPLFDLGSTPQESPDAVQPLFGHDSSAHPYEISILMDIDLGSKTLRAASVAAIDWGSDDKGRKIYYEEEIPAIAMVGRSGPDDGDSLPTAPDGWNEPDSGGFDEFLGDEGEETGSGPA